MSQSGITILQEEAVFLRISAFNLQFLGIGIHLAVYHSQDFRLMLEIGLLYIITKACPVFRLIGCPDKTIVKIVKPTDILFKGFSTAYSQFRIVGIRTLRRRKSLEPYRVYSHVLVVAHRVDSRLYTCEFRRIAAIVRIDNSLVDREIYVCRPLKRAVFDLRLGTDIDKRREEFL